MVKRYDDLFIFYDGKLIRRAWINGLPKSEVGLEAGCIDAHGYVVVRVLGKKKKAHRIIWEMINGEIQDGMEIDHINGIRNDNRIENLRVVNRSENQLNAKRRSGSNAVFTGVGFHKKTGKWCARFRNIHLGSYNNVVEAFEARVVAEVSCGICTERHGR